ncbi:G-protein coupled receptor 1 [Branchiostoma belcheri]|nr:G-protein coupled receptor 1 [Branchiostoma belcheri]
MTSGDLTPFLHMTAYVTRQGEGSLWTSEAAESDSHPIFGLLRQVIIYAYTSLSLYQLVAGTIQRRVDFEACYGNVKDTSSVCFWLRHRCLPITSSVRAVTDLWENRYGVKRSEKGVQPIQRPQTSFINGVWQLGFLMCDVFVALDVMLCTASIFNLVAISIDRFYAVTWPVRYSKHKSNNRLAITITLVWTLSFGISAPLLFGSNYPATGERSPEMCGIFNTNYMIYSSMCSFFIPCTAMLVLYYKILKKIKERSKKMAKKMPKSTSAGMVCEDTVIAHTTTSSGIAMKENGASKKTLSTPVLDGHAVSVVDANSRPSSESDISVAMAAETNQSDEAVRTPRGTKLPKTRLDAIKSKLKGKAKDEFPNRREQKAINVMKIVIGVFLICWTPFFVTNVVRACSTCTIPDTLFSIVTWLGYLNSGMNPIIYTIFNDEFRIAFRKLLCKGQGR